MNTTTQSSSMLIKSISFTLLLSHIHAFQINSPLTTLTLPSSSSPSSSQLKAAYDPQEQWSNNNQNASSKTYVLRQKQKAEETRKDKKKAITAGGTSDETTTVRLFKKADSMMNENTRRSKPGTPGIDTVNIKYNPLSFSKNQMVNSNGNGNNGNNGNNGGGFKSTSGINNQLSNFFSPPPQPRPPQPPQQQQQQQQSPNGASNNVRSPTSYIRQPNGISNNNNNYNNNPNNNNPNGILSNTPNTLLDRVRSPIEKLNIDGAAETIINDVTGYTTTIINSVAKPIPTVTVEELEEIDEYEVMDVNDKFSMAQRIESIKAGIVGLVTGGVTLAPFAAIHDIMMSDDSITNGPAQWEFDTDTGALAAALFAIVYRYCVRDGEQRNEMLQLGVIGAFVVVRTFARIRVPIYCSEAPLDCGEPFGYFDYDMIQQAVGSGLESVVMFGTAAIAIEYCSDRKWIKRFR